MIRTLAVMVLCGALNSCFRRAAVGSRSSATTTTLEPFVDCFRLCRAVALGAFKLVLLSRCTLTKTDRRHVERGRLESPR